MDPALTSLLFLSIALLAAALAAKLGEWLAKRHIKKEQSMDTPTVPTIHPDFTPEQAARAIAVWSVTTLLATNHAELGTFGFDTMVQKKANFILHGQHIQNYYLRED